VVVSPAALGPAKPLKVADGLVVITVKAEHRTRVLHLELASNSRRPVAPPLPARSSQEKLAASTSDDSSENAADAPVALSSRPQLRLDVRLHGVGVSLVSAAPQELLYVTVGDITFFFSDSPAQKILETSVVRPRRAPPACRPGHARADNTGLLRCTLWPCATRQGVLQIDNQLNRPVYPMVLYRVPPRADSARAAQAAALPTLRASAVIEASGIVTRTAGGSQ